jgi:hypothetical protein
MSEATVRSSVAGLRKVTAPSERSRRADPERIRGLELAILDE